MRAVYQITDERTGAVYIGSSNAISIRWKDHLTREGIIDDPTAFSFKILEVVEPAAELNNREAFWVSYLTEQGATVLNTRYTKDNHQAHRKYYNYKKRTLEALTPNGAAIQFTGMNEAAEYLREVGVTTAMPSSIQQAISRSMRIDKPYKGYTFRWIAA